MMSVRVCVAAMLMCVSSGAAFANEPPSSPRIDEIRVEPVSAFEQTGNVNDLFYETNNGGLGHVHSGLACRATNEKITLVGITVLDEFGREVACDYVIPDTSTNISIFVTQHNGENVQQEIDRTAVLLRQKVDAELAGKPRIIGSSEVGGMMPVAAKLNFMAPPGTPMSTSIWVNAINGWMVKVRATYSAEEEEFREAEFEAAFIWVIGAVGVWSHEAN